MAYHFNFDLHTLIFIIFRGLIYTKTYRDFNTVDEIFRKDVTLFERLHLGEMMFISRARLQFNKEIFFTSVEIIVY